MKIRTLTVSEINNYLKKIIDSDFILNNLSVKGEISNLKMHSSGHIYFSLKDGNSKVNCIMFKGDAASLNITLKDGLSVIISCRLSIYQKEGSYQLYCKEITLEGIGDLYFKYEKLKKRLFEEGLFDKEKKKEIPKFIKKVGVVTSPTGAAIKDIKKVIRRKNNILDIILFPSKVQGEGASKTIIEGIKYFNLRSDIDAIIIGRGGGSIEELWAFNDENLAYEIYKSKIPIISAVGHEVDFTISDYVSDYRAATPTAAGDFVAEDITKLQENLDNYLKHLNNYLRFTIDKNKNKLEHYKKVLEVNNPGNIIANNVLKVSEMKDKLDKMINSKMDKEFKNIISLNELIKAYNPLNILNKGYSVILDDNKVIKSTEEIKIHKEYKVILKDGTAKCTFNDIERGVRLGKEKRNL